jgi:hypothetical protein
MKSTQLNGRRTRTCDHRLKLNQSRSHRAHWLSPESSPDSVGLDCRSGAASAIGIVWARSRPFVVRAVRAILPPGPKSVFRWMIGASLSSRRLNGRIERGIGYGKLLPPAGIAAQGRPLRREVPYCDGKGEGVECFPRRVCGFLPLAAASCKRARVVAASQAARIRRIRPRTASMQPRTPAYAVPAARCSRASRRTRTHTQTRAYPHADTHRHARAHPHTLITLTRRHTRAHVGTHPDTHTHTRTTRTLSRAREHTHAHIRTHTHQSSRARTHARTHAWQRLRIDGATGARARTPNSTADRESTHSTCETHNMRAPLVTDPFGQANRESAPIPA